MIIDNGLGERTDVVVLDLVTDYPTGEKDLDWWSSAGNNNIQSNTYIQGIPIHYMWKSTNMDKHIRPPYPCRMLRTHGYLGLLSRWANVRVRARTSPIPVP